MENKEEGGRGEGKETWQAAFAKTTQMVLCHLL